MHYIINNNNLRITSNTIVLNLFKQAHLFLKELFWFSYEAEDVIFFCHDFSFVLIKRDFLPFFCQFCIELHEHSAVALDWIQLQSLVPWCCFSLTFGLNSCLKKFSHEYCKSVKMFSDGILSRFGSMPEIFKWLHVYTLSRTNSYEPVLKTMFGSL